MRIVERIGQGFVILGIKRIDKGSRGRNPG